MKTNRKATQWENEDNSALRKLFIAELQDIYWAEKHLMKALPKMAKAAQSPELSKAIEKHLAETEEQVARVEQVFEAIGEPAKAKKCEAMNGLLKEAEELMDEFKGDAALDAAIIAAAQKVEHYEIASYGTMATFARMLGQDKAAKLLIQTLDEEKNADSTLTDVAESFVNEEADVAEEKGKKK